MQIAGNIWRWVVKWFSVHMEDQSSIPCWGAEVESVLLPPWWWWNAISQGGPSLCWDKVWRKSGALRKRLRRKESQVAFDCRRPHLESFPLYDCDLKIQLIFFKTSLKMYIPHDCNLKIQLISLKTSLNLCILHAGRQLCLSLSILLI